MSGFMLNSLATCSTLFSSIIRHLHFWPQHRYVQIAKISSAYLPYRTIKYAVVNVIVFTVNSNRVHRLSGFPVRCLSLLGLCHLFSPLSLFTALNAQAITPKAPISTPTPIATITSIIYFFLLGHHLGLVLIVISVEYLSVLQINVSAGQLTCSLTSGCLQYQRLGLPFIS